MKQPPQDRFFPLTYTLRERLFIVENKRKKELTDESKSVRSLFMNHEKALPNRCREWPQPLKRPVMPGFFRGSKSLPLFFGVLLWRIYALNIIPNSNIAPPFPLIISFIKIFVAENVAKSPVGQCRVVCPIQGHITVFFGGYILPHKNDAFTFFKILFRLDDIRYSTL